MKPLSTVLQESLVKEENLDSPAAQELKPILDELHSCALTYMGKDPEGVTNKQLSDIMNRAISWAEKYATKVNKITGKGIKSSAAVMVISRTPNDDPKYTSEIHAFDVFIPQAGSNTKGLYSTKGGADYNYCSRVHCEKNYRIDRMDLADFNYRDVYTTDDQAVNALIDSYKTIRQL